MKKYILALCVMFPVMSIAGVLPSVPGATNPNVTQANINQTICVSGFTKTIRPPASYTNALKRKQLVGAADTNPRDYEEDHLISLEIGGSPTSPQNLWPEPYNPPGGWGAHKKDQLENTLHKMVCSGAISLSDAQKAISTDWVKSYVLYVK